MKHLLLVFLISLFSVSTAWSADGDIPCGMILSQTDSYMVEAQNGEICPQDLAFQGTYLMFSEVFQDPTIRPLALLFVDEATLDSEFTKFADETISVSKPIHFILSSVAVLVWILAAAIVSGKIYQYVMMVKKSGSFAFAESRGDTVLFISYFMFLMVLLTPMGISGGKNGDLPPLTFGQGLAVLGSLPANMGGNYIYSTYLAATQTASRDVPLDEESMLMQSQMVSNGLIEGQVCMDSTQKAILAINGKYGSPFFEAGFVDVDVDVSLTGNWREGFVNVDTTSVLDFDEFSQVYNYCLSYLTEGKDGPLDDSVSELYWNKFTAREFASLCNNDFNFDQKSYGYDHTCLKASYDFGASKFNEVEDVVGDSLLEWDTGTDRIRDQLKAPNLFPSFKSTFEGKIRGIINEELDPQATYEKLNDLFVGDGASAIAAQLNNTPDLQRGTNEEKQARHLAAIGFLLGGTNEKAFAETMQTVLNVVVPVSNLLSSTWFSSGRFVPALQPVEEVYYGIDVLMAEARIASDLLQQHHCAINWEDQSNIRQFIINYNSAEDDRAANALFEAQIDTQCLRVLHEDDFGSTRENRYVSYWLDDPRVFDDFKDETGSVIPQRLAGEAILSETAAYMKEEKSLEILKEYQVKQFLIAGYQASVQIAMVRSLRDSLSINEVEEKKDIALRPKGWGLFGGALLYIGQTQNSSMHMSRSFQDVLAVESSGGDSRLIERKAFDVETNDSGKVNQTILEMFEGYDRSTYFSYGPLSTVSDRARTISEDEIEESALQTVIFQMERLLLGPMSHIKAASGMDPTESLAMGLQRCFDDGYSSCMSGTKHPIVALSNFGHDMINNMIIALVTGQVLNVLDKAINSDDDDAGSLEADGEDKDKDGFFKNLMKKAKYLVSAPAMLLLKTAQAILTLAAMIFSALTPIFSMLLLVGIVFAYVIPMMAYIFGFMILALYWLGIFIVAVAMPIYVLLKLLTIEKDYQNGFKQFYQEIMGVYATPIFFAISAVVSWSIIVILMYAINISFAVLHAGLSAGATMLSALVINIFMYIVYFTAIFVLFRFGLGIMKDMPDTLREKLNMKKSGDDDYINSLGFEQYVQTQVSQAVVNMPAKMAAAVQAHSAGGAGSYKALQAQVDQAEAVVSRLGLDKLSAEEIDAKAEAHAADVAANQASQQQDQAGDNNASGSGDSGKGSNSSDGKKEGSGSSPSLSNDRDGPTDTPDSVAGGNEQQDGNSPSFERGSDSPKGDNEPSGGDGSKDNK